MIPLSAMTSSRKLIGYIIPAIITTTAVVSGLACIEMVKALKKAKDETRSHNTHNSPLTCHREYCWDLGSPCGDVGWTTCLSQTL